MYNTVTPVRAHRGWNGRSSLWAFLGLALAARRQRKELEKLGPERLKDIGLTEEQARHEALKPAWNVPAHWLR